jgi:hypothetical protein
MQAAETIGHFLLPPLLSAAQKTTGGKGMETTGTFSH